MTAATAGHALIGADALSHAEAISLADCEERIERGMKTFIEVGMALAAIQQHRLYRVQFDTFEEYCAARWNFTGRRGRQLIEAAEIGRILPIANAGQAAELAKVPEPERAEVLAEATERSGGKPTAKVIAEVVKERAEPKPDLSPEVPDVLNALATFGAAGATAWRVAFLLDSANPRADRVAEILGELADAGTVDPAGRAREGNRMVPVWALPDPADTQTPGPVAVSPSVVAGPGSASDASSPAPEPEPERHLTVVRDPIAPPAGSPAAWSEEEQEANRREIERKQSIAAAERFAGALVMEVRGMVTTIIDGLDFGASRDLVTAEMIAECRAALDRLEARVIA